MITSDARTPCLEPEAVRRRLHQAVRAGAVADEAIADAITDARATAENFLGERIERSAIVEDVTAAQEIRLSVQPVLLVNVVTVGGDAVDYFEEDGVLTLTLPPAGPVHVEYVAGKDAGNLDTCVAIIKRAATRIMTNPTGVIQAQGPGSAFSPEPSGVQAILTRSERDTLLTTRDRWYVG